MAVGGEAQQIVSQVKGLLTAAGVGSRMRAPLSGDARVHEDGSKQCHGMAAVAGTAAAEERHGA
jgi:hypothetical protein